ncbi:hypothetical protein ACPB9J_33820 [Streptomyces lavendulocolor]|uniref:hypothetical protein n=1 Tax=Streptomyces lavendulocolor TaxID=67316 RepID=UPI003C2EA12C
MTNRPNDLPPFVTFATGAELLRRLGIDPDATPDSVRHLARARGEKWAFGDGPGQTPYGRVANARTMDTIVFLDHLEAEPPNPHGRGRDRKPRARRGT